MTEKGKFVLIAVKVTPNAPKDAIIGWEGGRLRVRIRAVPEKGKANAHLLEFLANQLGIAKSNLSIASGKTSQLKRVRIDGLSEAEFHSKIGTNPR